MYVPKWPWQNIVFGVKNPSIIPIIQSSNLYNYCVNNPLMYVDPSGEWAKGIGLTLYISFIIRIELQGYYVWDDNGNEGIILIAGGGGGTPNAGISGSKFTTKSADTIFDLEGMSLSAGGSVGYVGADVNGDFGGGSVSGGPSVLPMEMHGTITFGEIIFNW
ncbi:MAG: hypothetical protein IJO09_01050 [Oscillospiraceae bacterium]|nr:hypothetical protein [Oscillospiraceae bacterium]